MSYGQPSKYDISVNPVYQVDWQHEASGKRVAATKRRVRFRFGFSNREAIEKGYTGTDCRGEEHEVVLVWSLASGKRLVVADGVEVHFSTGKFTDNLFETSWTIAGGHMIKISAYAAPPLFPTPGFRQFDLQIDGLSFFNMPKIYELGVVEAGVEATYEEPVPVSSPSFAMPSVERRARYIETNDRSFSAVPEPNPVTPEFATRRNTMPELDASPVQQQPTDILASQQAHAPVVQYSPPAPVQQPAQQSAPVDLMQSATQPFQDEFAPVPPSPPTYADKSQTILSAYTPSNPLPAIAYTPYYSHAEYDSASPGATLSDVSDFDEDSQQTPLKDSPVVLKPTMAPISIAEMEEQEEEPKTEVDRAMKSLVNLDDITFTMETPEQAKTVRRAKEKKESNTTKSNPLPPSAPASHMGAKATLQDMKKHATPKESTKEVMRTHAFDPRAQHAGMMVVYGATTMPPPAQGFGAGVHPSFHAQPVTGVPPPPLYAAY